MSDQILPLFSFSQTNIMEKHEQKHHRLKRKIEKQRKNASLSSKIRRQVYSVNNGTPVIYKINITLKLIF